MKKTVGIYSLIIGISVICIWLVILFSSSVPEGKIELGFHLYAEFSMAAVCLVSGFMMLINKPLSVETNIGGMGMVVYSCLNAAGYYGQNGSTSVMILFILLFLTTVGAICIDYLILKRKKQKTV
ncbi:MAG: hypothetical protein JXB19_08855 [Bacteroidales bacterium]|nr:hypothetical protein [Bacteroidales bacterium]